MINFGLSSTWDGALAPDRNRRALRRVQSLDPLRGGGRYMGRAASALSAAVVGVVLLLAAGCAQATNAGVGDADLSGVGGGSGEDCDSGGNLSASPPVLTPLPADAVLVAATRCVFQPQPVPGDGEW